MENVIKNININKNENQHFQIEIKDELLSDTEYNDEENYGSLQKCSECENKLLYQTSLETFEANDQNWKCNHCIKDYNYPIVHAKGILVENHITKTENEKNSYKCNYCNSSFMRERYLIAHERIHSEDKVYNCRICNKAFTQHSNSIRHEKLHNIEKVYECKLCGKKFIRQRYLNAHERIHSAEQIYECNVCPETFVQQSNLLLHKRIHLENKSKSLNEVTTPQINSPTSYKCKTCEQIFSSYHRLFTHRVLHKKKIPYKCRICNKKFSNLKTLRKHRQNTCCACEKQFSTRLLLIEHQKTCSAHVEKTKVHKCNICSKFFATRIILKVHEKTHDQLEDEKSEEISSSTSKIRSKIDSYEIKINGEEIFYINNSFTNDENIKSKTFKCSKCNLSFYQEICLIKHESIHNGAYYCKICDEIFLIKHHLKLHKQLHLNETPSTCECTRQFYHGRYLMLHTKLHERGQRFNCIYCGQDYKHFDALVQHEKYHLTGKLNESNENKCKKCFCYKCKCNKKKSEWKYICKTCGKSFTARSNLLVHERIHTGEKPYKCKTCKMVFRQLNHFKTHVRKKHATKMLGRKRIEYFECNGCGKLFKKKAGLSLHIARYQKLGKKCGIIN